MTPVNSAITAADLRRIWTEYWTGKGHTIVPSASLIPTHPTAPMFANAGMNQFVPYFLGEQALPFVPPRAASIQKCARAGGKHNDLDAIGRSLRHLSFFEMLGNFSFGDYFKRDAIVWAWEFVTGVLGVDATRIWVTVHVSDDEAEQIWREEAGLPAERIQRLDKDNFWEMGDTGPCGPSSELFYDFGPEHGPDGGPANPAAEHRFIEFWNLVFQQYFRDSTGSLTPLPEKNVDTGAGLERVVGILRGSPSLYECDTLARLVTKAEEITGRRLGQSGQDDIGLRLIADHARSMTFLIADGVVPGNAERGYVLRRIIRRAIRYAYLLDSQAKVTPLMAEHVVDMMGDAYPELTGQRDLVLRILNREEEQFSKTLRTGLGILEAEAGKLPPHGVLPGEVAFTLHDTYGFPLEVTAEIVAERGMTVDTGGFAQQMASQRARGRAARKRTGVGDRHNDYQQILESSGPTAFTGHPDYQAQARVLAVLPGSDGTEVFLDRTPFCAEQGGQAGDTGVIVRNRDGARFAVADTVYAAPGLHLHRVPVTPGVVDLTAGDEVTAEVDGARRAAVRRNHTGTHLLHWALREVLGAHVKQQGSLVGPDRLRLDFSHFEPVTADQLKAAEDLVNGEILADGTVRQYESMEQCGGMHVAALGQVGSLKVVSEGSAGANLRRVEAVTGMGTIELLRRTERTLLQTAAERQQLRQRLEQATVGDLVGRASDGVLVTEVECDDTDNLRRLATLVVKQGGLRAAVLGSVTSAGRPAVAAAVADTASLNAAELLEPVSQSLGGGHGKQRDVAIAGGRDASQLGAALEAVRLLLA